MAPADPSTPPAPGADSEGANGAERVAVTLEQLATDATPQATFDRHLVELRAKVAQPGQLEYGHDAIGVALTSNGKLDAILGASPFVTALFARDGAESARLRTLAPYQEVTVSGELRFAADNVWELHGAQLVKAGDDPSVAIGAAELTQAFMESAEAARTQFADRALRITGKVSGKPVRFGEYAALSLAGATDGEGRTTVVIAQFKPDHFNTYGSPPLDGTSLVELLPWQDGADIEILGTLQDPEFGEDADGRPALAVVAYPVRWPVE